ncbi:hypothetical protein [Aureimonas leprariae]|uniref:Uncharacterized protein n=1 Tax=Plantimonas leprariae TaxID=2615207 RepID=A0A7V7PQ30_9HYPH|nr:hypothetical protein [Aureimonas leprariae]KAB0680162.1 hypothetical protein F6X38_08200 [Aureimonas leprariae]
MSNLDLTRIKSNVYRMAAQNAPEADIDAYLAEEGTTADAVKAYAPNLSGQQLEAIMRGRENVANGRKPEGHAEGKFGGAAMNATAGANEALYGVLGAPVDATRGLMNLGIRATNAVTGGNAPELPDTSFLGSRNIAETLGGIDPRLDPANTVAQTEGDRVARGAGAGAAGAIVPELAARTLIEKGIVNASPQAMRLAEGAFGRSATGGQAVANAVIGAAGGAGGTAAADAAPEPLKPLAGLLGGMAAGAGSAGLLGVPMIVKEGVRHIGRYAEPLTQGGRQRLAADRLRSSATDSQALRDSLEAGTPELVPGSQPTTFQATGDMGIGALERGAAARQPDRFMQRRAEQNAAQVAAIGAIQPDGAPETVVSAIRGQLADIDREADDIVTRARDGARASADRLGAGQTPDAAGASLRTSLEAARATVKQRERELWNAVDPDGTMTLGVGTVKGEADSLLGGIPKSAKQPDGEEMAIYGVVGQYGDAMPLSEVTALSSRVKAAMRAERMANGESPAYARMAKLSSAIHADLDGAVAGRVQQEAEAVARGEMREEDTFAANFRRAQEEWLAQREAGSQQATGTLGGEGPSGFRANGAGGPRSLSGMAGAEGETGRRLPDAPSNPRLPGDDVGIGFDRAAQERLTAARAATSDRLSTFDNPTLRPLRQRPATNAPYAVPDSSVPARIFFPQAKSFDAIQSYRRAVGDGPALDTLTGYAVDRARRAALRDDGTFDPTRLAAWRRSHADALRAFPELDAGLADASAAANTLAHVVQRQNAARDDAARGVLGRLLGLDDPSDVTRTVGAVFQRQDAAAQMLRLRHAIRGSEPAQRGLRKAIVDHIAGRFVGNTEAGTSGIGTVKSDGFQSFVRQNGAALRTAGFSDAEIGTMQRVAADLQRANRSVASVKLPGGSNTVQDAIQAGKLGSQPTLLSRIFANVPTAAGGAGGFMLGGGPISAAVGAVGAKTIADIRRAGIESIEDLVADALLNPTRAKLLLATPARKTERATWELLGQYYRRAATVGAVAGPNQAEPEQRGAVPR